MLRDKSCDFPNCQRAHLDVPSRPRCETFEKYGFCDRGDARDCWLRHEPCEAWEMDVCLMVDMEMAARHVERARRILGPRAVVKAGRIKLSRHTDALICIKSDALGAAGAMRALYREEPYGMAKTKRTFVFPREGGWSRTFEGLEWDDEAIRAMDAWLEKCIDACVEESGATREKPVYARVRAAPRWLEGRLHDAMDRIIDARGDTLACKPLGGGITTRDCTHCIDAVNLWDRAYVGVWKTSGIYETMEVTGSAPTQVLPEKDAPQLPPAGEASMDDLAFYFPLKLQDYRVEVKPLCRAYFKLHEALLRGRVPIEGDWNCVDIGAAPGGWTQVLSERLTTGCVWAIDPAEITLNPFPTTMTHLRVLAEDAVETVREGLQSTASGELRLVVCDANMHPEACLRIALDFSTKFSSMKESWLVMSTKNFCKRRENWLKVIDTCIEQCRDAGYDDVFVEHLFSNCSEEKTLFARRKGKD
tara:strand:+ start:5248 stop:6672 length:1425 start_codon:yes stop_codon:yes gene_type:complete